VKKAVKSVLNVVITSLLLVQLISPLAFSATENSDESFINEQNVNVNIFGVDSTEWSYNFFGSNTSASNNPAPTIHDATSLTMAATGGKIASTEEGISFFSKELTANDNFQLTATVKVNQFNQDNSISTPNQKSFGLMIKDEINVGTSNYVAVGALDTVMKPFYKHDNQVKLAPFSDTAAPTSQSSYQLGLTKNGNVYTFTLDDKKEIVELPDLFNAEIHAGLYVVRDANITFEDVSCIISTEQVQSLSVDTTNMKTSYLLNEELNIAGLTVVAELTDNTSRTLAESEYVITGFDNSVTGTQQLSVHYNGVVASFDVVVTDLIVEELTVKYFPAKTKYYLGDILDTAGMEIVGRYNNGESAVLNSEQFTVAVETPFSQAGNSTVTISSITTPIASTSFDVEVVSATLEQLLIRTPARKQVYFLNETLSLDGLIIHAEYSDNTQVRLTAADYVVNTIDTSSIGTKEVIITHKDKTVAFNVEVREKVATGIEVNEYPQTTYEVGATFDSTGLVVAKKYDSGDEEILTSSDYTIAAPLLDSIGQKEVTITPNDSSLAPIKLLITVRDAVTYEWKSIIFGQSASASRNQIIEHPDGSIEIIALEGGGKITGDHDGISFYYTELDATKDNFKLSATIDVVEYAKTPHDGQESFGITARDAIGEPNNSSVFAANIAAIGGYSGGTREVNGIKLLARTGVESSDGTGSLGVQSKMLLEGKPSGIYQLELEKTNSGFAGRIVGGDEDFIFEPDILTTQDDKMYVGFYSARLATIIVSNIDLEVSAMETDAPLVLPPVESFAPKVTVVSLDKTAETAYDLKVRANTSGTFTVKQKDEYLINDVAVVTNEVLTIPTELISELTDFSITFYPNDDDYLTSYDKVIRNFTVQKQAYNGDVYVGPNGTKEANGTKESPIDLDTAIQFLAPGQKIIMLDGVYTRNSKLEIKKYNDGRRDAYKQIVADTDAKVVLDFDSKTEGIELSGNYWHIQNIEVTNSAGNTKGFTIGGSHNIIEGLQIYQNGDTGLQISRIDPNEPREEWPSYNKIINVTSFDNKDPSNNNADGFAAKLTVGEGNIFSGCIAYNNVDDGWDLYTKLGTGAIGAVVIESSVAYNNGYVSFDPTARGDGNGFKIGGEGIHVPHKLIDSRAFGNLADGVTSNSNPGLIVENVISYDNAGRNFTLTTYSHIPEDFQMKNLVSYQKNYTTRDSFPQSKLAEDTYMFDGTVSKNSLGEVVTDESFESLDAQLPYQRDENGNIIWGNFLKTDLIKLDYSLLAEKLTVAKALSNDLDIYTTESFENLQNIIQEIEQKMNDYSTQKEITDAINLLDTAMENLIDNPTEDSTDNPTEDSTDNPTEDSTDNPTEDSTDNPTEDSTDNPTEDSTDNPTDDSTDNPTEDSTDNPTEDSTDNPTDDSIVALELTYKKELTLEVDDTTTEADFIQALEIASNQPYIITTNFATAVDLKRAETYYVQVEFSVLDSTALTFSIASQQLRNDGKITDTIKVVTTLKHTASTTDNSTSDSTLAATGQRILERLSLGSIAIIIGIQFVKSKKSTINK
jgi:Cobalamin biosynthesis protein CobT (nicotinate-mononucleotide:5, 6-dimethylbenzimidazole phosphoribosyltransferase)